MRIKSLFLFLVLVCCNSCIVRSWNAFYFESQKVKESFVLGVWRNGEEGQDTEGQWLIEELRGAEQNQEMGSYRMSYFQEKQGRLTAHFDLSLFKLNEILYADIQDVSLRDENLMSYVSSPLALFSQVPVHIIAKVEKRESGGFNFRFLNEKAIAQKKVKFISRSANETDTESEIMLIASTKKLQRWLKKIDDSQWDIEYGLRPIIEKNTLE
jgi:hypothetical protein